MLNILALQPSNKFKTSRVRITSAQGQRQCLIQTKLVKSVAMSLLGFILHHSHSKSLSRRQMTIVQTYSHKTHDYHYRVLTQNMQMWSKTLCTRLCIFAWQHVYNKVLPGPFFYFLQLKEILHDHGKVVDLNSWSSFYMLTHYRFLCPTKYLISYLLTQMCGLTAILYLAA